MPSPFDGTLCGPHYRGSPPPTGRRLSIISNRLRRMFPSSPSRGGGRAGLRLWPPGKSGSKASVPPASRTIPQSRKLCDCPLSNLGPLLRGRHPRRRSVVSARRAGNRSAGALTCAKLGVLCREVLPVAPAWRRRRTYRRRSPALSVTTSWRSMRISLLPSRRHAESTPHEAARKNGTY